MAGTIQAFFGKQVTPIYIGKISYGLYIYHHFVGAFFDIYLQRFSQRWSIIINAICL